MSLTPRQKRWYWLLLLPLLNVLALPLYNRIDPTLFGIPLFYWYQLGEVDDVLAIANVAFIRALGQGRG